MQRYLASLILFAGCVSAHAQQAVAPGGIELPSQPRGFFTFIWENDKFAGTDRNYTNGNRISFTTPVGDFGKSAAIADMFLRATRGHERTLFTSWSVGQSIFTPENTQAAGPLHDQHPYAGWLYGEASLIAGNACRGRGEVAGQNCLPGAESIALQLGVVGPSAQGEFVQNNFHRAIGVDPARGWANQLHDEMGIGILYDRRWQWRYWQLGAVGLAALGVDLIPSYGWAAGNILTQASAGMSIRLGTGLKEMDLPARVRPSTPGEGLFGGTGFAWYLFASAEGRAVARNIFLDGNTFRDSLSVDKRPLVADFQVGAVLRLNDVELTYTYVTRTEEFETQGSAQQFGSVGITYRF